jgi:hypothetical protein
MSLRPRYSLLTLLVLTALLAGGVKLWRGPHRVVLDPTSVADRERFFDLLMLVQLNNQNGQKPVDELSYTYRRRFGREQEVECFVYTFKRPVYLVTGHYGHDRQKRDQFLLRSDTPPTDAEILTAAARNPVNNDFEIELVEPLSFWIGGNLLKEPSTLGGEVSPSNKHGENVVTLTTQAVYFGTSQGKVYRRKYGSTHLVLMYDAPYRAIELHDIEPAELQAHVAAEFARHRQEFPATR